MDHTALGTSDYGPAAAGQLQDLVIDSEDVSSFLSELCEFSAKSFCASMGMEVVCAVTLHRHRRLNTAAWSTPDARKFDEIQQGFGEGPCLHSMETQTTVLVRDTRTDPRWPDYCQAMAAQGQLSVLGVPLALDEGATAALNIFATVPDAFDPGTITSAELFAAQAQKALRLAVRIAVRQQLADDLRAAMESRTTIDLAAGIIMGQNRCSQSEAMAILTKASSGRNKKLRDVAAGLVSSFDGVPVTTHFDS
jgi:GAF domain-containing protein